MSTPHSNTSSKTYTNQNAFHHATGSTATENKETTSIWHPSRGIRFRSTSLSPHSGTTDGDSQEEKVLDRMALIPTRRRNSSPTENPQRLNHPRVESLPPGTLGKSTDHITQESQTPRSGKRSSLDVGGQLSGLSCSGSASQNLSAKPWPKRRDDQTSRPTDAFLGECNVAAVNYKFPEVPSSEVTAQSSLAHVLAQNHSSGDLRTRLHVTTARSFSRAKVIPQSARAKTRSKFKQTEDELDLGPEYWKFKTLRLSADKSCLDLRRNLTTILEELDSKYTDRGLKPWETIIPLYIARIECDSWLEHFGNMSHYTRKYIRFREEWDALLQGRKVRRFALGSDLVESMRFLTQAILEHPFFASYESLHLHLYSLLMFQKLHRVKSHARLGKVLTFENQVRSSFLTDLDATYASIVQLGKQIDLRHPQETEQSRQLFKSIFTLQHILWHPELITEMDKLRGRTDFRGRSKVGLVRVSTQVILRSLCHVMDVIKNSAGSGGITELSSPVAKHLFQMDGAGEGKPQLDTMTLCASRDKAKTGKPYILSPTYLQAKDFELDGMASDSSEYLPHKPWPKVVRFYQACQTKGEFVSDDERGDSCLQAEAKGMCWPEYLQAETTCHSSTKDCAGKDDLSKEWPSSPWPRYISPALPNQPTYNTLSQGNAHVHEDKWVKYTVIEAKPTGLEPGTNCSTILYPQIQHHSTKRPESSGSLFSGNSTSRTPSSDMAAPRSNAAGFHSLAAARIESSQAASASTDDEQSFPATKDEVVGLAGSPLGYHIPSAKMRESLLASRSSRSAFWQYTFYQGPKGEKVKVHYCKSLETMERIAKLFLNEKVLGFDIEWKPSATAKDGIRKNVALIQIASEERIALFHLARFAKGNTVDEVLSPTFKKLMESDSISKVGVSVKGDSSRLRKYMNIESRGLFELSHLYKLVKFCTADVKKINKMLVGLAKQVEEHLLLPMYKDQSVRASDWSEDLNYEQIY
ncbi:MAG: hypothetical protein Q9212_006469, partial [Teloschistes hypoglaucus]